MRSSIIRPSIIGQYPLARQSESASLGQILLSGYGLPQNLQGWMIFFIVITSLIGSGIFSTGGPAIEVAGPGGALLALVIVGEQGSIDTPSYFALTFCVLRNYRDLYGGRLE
ncbi:hypothetical protein SNOG_09964 [Parastagonospora nodorum SN15]|uniref:Amino acid permease/ SLC12A domain-containing protein n=1 Tax=Phaeosphaeria nodorum (strain SN15 / ATCC MYA-4574 / FGSC 10173) TaxID=321614 RepID=Q0UE50_PHANO|nr:hypothetical protein SNOG_09964 [Parastagonospora nodorum SN15]EAT82299.1 hypothetical protein SNOG_09964 [Parastagonospora nodorum SN15]